MIQHDAYYNRGIAKSDLEDYYGAISDYTKAIEINPKDPDSYNNRGYSKHMIKDYEAINDFNKVLTIDKNKKLHITISLGQKKINDNYGAIFDNESNRN